MYKSIFLIVAVFFLSNYLMGNIELRNQYEKAIYSKDLAENLLKTLNAKASTTTTEKGYKGALKMILAKHYYNPINKYNSFNTGKTELQKAIETDPSNAELIFLRYSCSVNAPSFLNYKTHVAADKAFLEKSLLTMKDNDLKKRIQVFMGV